KLPPGQFLSERQRPQLGSPDGDGGSRAGALRAGSRTDIWRVDGGAPEGPGAAGARRERQGRGDPRARQGPGPAPGPPADGRVPPLGAERAESRPAERPRPPPALRGDRRPARAIPGNRRDGPAPKRRIRLVIDGGPDPRADLEARRSVDVLVGQPAKLRHVRV